MSHGDPPGEGAQGVPGEPGGFGAVDHSGQSDDAHSSGDAEVEPRHRSLVWVFGLVVVVLLAGIALYAVVKGRDDDEPGAEGAAAGAPSTTTSTEAAPSAVSVVEPGDAALTYEAACSEGLSFSIAPGVSDPNLVEVSGAAVDANGTTWVINDSGDRPRIYGVSGEGAVQTVDVSGADAVDWEDLVLQLTGSGEVLWLADTGTNIEPRSTVQLYRVPVPGPGDAVVTATRFDVTYPDGSHDVEAVLVEPSGVLALITKDPGTPAVYRVDPSAGQAPTAERIGTFSVGDGERTVVTSADMAADGSTVILRTYGSVYLVPVDEGQPLQEALADRERHCRGIPPLELQGEAISFLPDGSGYVTMGEGRNPYLTTVSIPPASG